MDIEKAIKNVKEQLKNIKKANECGLATKGEFNEDIEAIETVLKELEQKDKIIDLIAEELRYQNGMGQDDLFCYSICKKYKYCDEETCKERIKQYFERKVKEC